MKHHRKIAWTTSDILEATGGERLAGSEERLFSGVAIDSRAIAPDDFFVAITGEVHDGHTFVADVLKRGVRGILVDNNKAGEAVRDEIKTRDIVAIGVADTTRALGDLAAYNRNRAAVSVVALTGSNGKTTTRTMLAHMVSDKLETLTTAGNYNNEIGLPLTLLELTDTHAWVVLELGMNHPGEIRRLAEICTPDIGMITNVGPAHLEGLGSIEGVMRAKGELLEKLNVGGKTVLNADDPNVVCLAEHAPGEVLLFGVSPDAAIRADHIRVAQNQVSFVLSVPGGTTELILDTPGRFMVSNALAAAAAGYLMGLSLQDIKAGLEDFKPVQGRLNIRELKTGTRIIDDTYNANPGSMRGALQTLKTIRKDRRCAVILGDMLELGEQSPALHHELGKYAAVTGPTRLYVTGSFADSVVRGAREGGMGARHIISGSKQAIAADLLAWAGPRDWILVKGSRGMRMETIVQELINTFGQR